MTGARGRDSGEGQTGKKPGEPDRVGDVLDGLYRRLGLTEALAGQSAIERWEDVVGERIARVASAQAVASGTLYVEVRSSGWLNELSLMRHEILRRLNAGRTEGRIERIVFRLAER